jgi:hypothetical protein
LLISHDDPNSHYITTTMTAENKVNFKKLIKQLKRDFPDYKFIPITISEPLGLLKYAHNSRQHGFENVVYCFEIKGLSGLQFRTILMHFGMASEKTDFIFINQDNVGYSSKEQIQHPNFNAVMKKLLEKVGPNICDQCTKILNFTQKLIICSNCSLGICDDCLNVESLHVQGKSCQVHCPICNELLNTGCTQLDHLTPDGERMGAPS